MREPQRTVVRGVDLETWRLGQGEPLLVLHDIEYLNEPKRFAELLAKDFDVVLPSHPGFGVTMPELKDSARRSS